jgi:hypothetical protein
MRYIPSSSNRVAPLANEEIKQMTRSKIWNNRGKDMFMMISFIFVGNKWKEMKSVFEFKRLYILRNEVATEKKFMLCVCIYC